ncbi:spermatogenesis associated 6-like protein [Lucilia cuprina]|uniref:spermatogenesis associated 6-like protein n=1 Tax=Lucilia cuprina TaxID=7375 RepID=UPI001F05E1E4|nr:spermatogenesis associated 6-like protein [Lucilia cuprina]
MDNQRFQVKINLKLEAVTCPGVWLCSHGYLEVTIKALGYFFRTGAMEPYFPLLCHDHFKMEGYFKNSPSLGHLINNLSKESLEITLWQNGRRLAYYQGVIMDLLQYIEPQLQCPHSNTRQILMKTTPAFPGILSPKVEITTEISIKDKILNLNNNSKDLRNCTQFLRKPQSQKQKLSKDIKPILYQRPCTQQTIRSYDCLDNPSQKRKQRTVCHTRDFKEAIIKPSPESVYSKSTGRRVSIASSCSSNNTHTSVGICDIEPDLHSEKFDDHNHEKFCELCRLYKEVFLQ